MALPPPAVATRRALVPQTRTAAVQRSDLPPTSRVVSLSQPLGLFGNPAMDPRFLTTYTAWQEWARRYAKEMGVVRFAAGIVADTLSRCDLRIEQRQTDGSWDEAQDGTLTQDFLEAYSNERQEAPELIRSQAWHYQIAGEMMQVITDSTDQSTRGVDWWLYSRAACHFNTDARPGAPNGTVTVKTTPNGDLRNGTAFIVPREYVTRFWTPDEEWHALATSPMSASIEDLHRLRALNRWSRRTADSRLAMDGVWWTPGEAHDDGDEQSDDPNADIDKPMSKLDADYYEAARRSYSDDDDVLAVAPFGMHWSKEFGEPKWYEIGRGLDEHALAFVQDALLAFARGVNLPGSLVASGGPGEGNHWTEWLVTAAFFDTISPTMDRMTHQDLTATVVRPLLRLRGLDADSYRLGYDPARVIVRQDQSDMALKLHIAGLLNGAKTLEAANFSPDDVMDDKELRRLLEVLSKAATDAGGVAPGAVSTGLAVTGANTSQTPPNGGQPPAALMSVPKAAAAKVTTEGTVTVVAANRLLRALSRNRSNLGRELLAGARVAFAQAMHHAGVKVQTRAAKRSAEVRAAVKTAVEADAPLTPHLAAVGVTEQELIHRQFDAFAAQARSTIATSNAQASKLLDDYGLDPDRVPTAEDAAVAVLVGGLTALAFQRLAAGLPEPTPGEITGDVPVSIVRETLAVARDGRAAVLPEDPRTMPYAADPVGAADVTTSSDALSGVAGEISSEATRSALATFEDRVASDLAAQVGDATIGYTWIWGYYGDPTTPFEDHEALGASEFTTTDPEGDAGLPDTAFGLAQPGDHDGCSCEWEPTIIPAGEDVTDEVPLEVPDLGADTASTQAAMEAAGVGPSSTEG